MESTPNPSNAAPGAEKTPENWLAFRLSSLGDVALTGGVLEYLHRERGLTFTLATRKPFGDLFLHHPAVREIREFSKAELAGLAGLKALRALAAEFSGQGLLDLHSSLRSRFLGLCWNGPVRRYPKLSLERRLFLREKSPGRAAPLLAASVTQRYALAMLDQAPPPEALRPKVYLTEEEKNRARKRLELIFAAPGQSAPGQSAPGQSAPDLEAEKSQAGPVILHPYATHARKTWPPENWRELARLLDKRGLPWICVGQGEALFPGDPRDLSNATGLRELCALLSLGALLVTGDSGPAHLAAAVDAPVLAMFGPTTREWGFYPCGPGDRVLELPLPCRPCSLHGASDCPRNGECMRGISVELVLENILAMTRA
ncbi:glycosyltransferase family 9 protein [Desulfovibrio sp. OttesenSCG-928-C14]|nr:glycosyltransferase family 9 protein [Desulfovibrio sp. OttesenSCG-928-C14]